MGSSGDVRILAEPCGDFAEPCGALRRLRGALRSFAETCGDFAEPCGALRRLAETCATIYLLADDVNCTSRLPLTVTIVIAFTENLIILVTMTTDIYQQK